MTKPKVAALVVVPQLRGESHKLTLGQIWFAAWRALPKDKREPTTRLELAERLGVDARTTYDWEKNPTVIGAIRTIGRRYGERDYGRVLAAVVRESIAGSVSHARLYFELMGDLGQEAIDAAFKKGESSVTIVQTAVLGDAIFDQRRLEVSPEIANRIAAAGDGHDGRGG